MQMIVSGSLGLMGIFLCCGRLAGSAGGRLNVGRAQGVHV